MNRKIAAALGLPEDAEPGEIIRRARGLQNQINASTRVQMNAVAELRRVREVCVNLQKRVDQFDKAISKIAQHVGACCGGVDTTDVNGLGSHTDQEIIRKIDAKVQAAVAELRRVRAELVKAKAALEPFGALFKSISSLNNDVRDHSVLIHYEGSIVTYGDLRRAFES